MGRGGSVGRDVMTINWWMAAEELFVPRQVRTGVGGKFASLAVLVNDWCELEWKMGNMVVDKGVRVLSLLVFVGEPVDGWRKDYLRVGMDYLHTMLKLGFKSGEEGPLLCKESTESIVLEGAILDVCPLGRRS